MKRKLFVYWCHTSLWLGKWYAKFKQTFMVGFYTTPQERREDKRLLKQAIHYNKHIVKPGGTSRSIVIAGRRF